MTWGVGAGAENGGCALTERENRRERLEVEENADK
jgi:hypothetical protein